MKKKIILSIALFLIVFSQTNYSQTTEFTYQGRLLDGTLAANGNYDFEFTQFDAQTGGTQIGSTLTINSVAVSNGVFTVRLDFGQVFGNGTDRFLEINVRQTGGGAFTPLTPRQPITSTPYAQKSLHSETASQAQNSAELGGFKPTDFTFTTDPRLSDDRNPLPGSTHYIQNTVTPPFSGFDITTEGEANSFNARLYFRLNNKVVLSNKGINNIFLGVDAGDRIVTHPNNTVGQGNTFVGNSAGLLNLVPNFNSFFGYSSGRSNTVGTRNSFFGYQSGFNNDASDNSFFGYRSGTTNTSGTENTFIGNRAGEMNSFGSFNTFLGSRAGEKATGSNNSFFGYFAGGNESGGTENTFIGANAGKETSSNGNTFVGFEAGLVNQNGFNNIFIGKQAGASNTQGGNNIFIGVGADTDTGGTENSIAIGTNALATGQNSIAIGKDTTVTANDSIAIGNGVTANISNVIRLGRFGLDFLSIGYLPPQPETLCVSNAFDSPQFNIPGRCSSSIRYKKDVTDFRPGMNLLKKLRPVSFKWKKTNVLDLGLVAEEVAEIEPLLTTTNSNGEIQGVKYNRIGVVAINAIVEQQEQIESQQKQIDEQKDIINQQSEKLRSQSEQLNQQSEKIEIQIKELKILKDFVCSQNPTAKFCAEKEENNEEN